MASFNLKYTNQPRKLFTSFFTEHPFAIFVTLSALVGVLSYFYAQGFLLTNEIFKRFYELSPISVFLICPLGLFAAYFLVWRFAPTSAGSGIPQVLASLELCKHDDEKSKISLKYLTAKRVLGVKLLSSLIANLSGAVIGREGPTIQLCSIFFIQGKEYFKKVRFFNRINLSTEVAIVTGAAAGLAAAFNTPLGGIMFAIEELAIGHLDDLRAKSILGVFVAGTVAQLLGGSYLFLGHPILNAFSFSKILIVLLFSALMGALGAFAGKLYTNILAWRSTCSNKMKFFLPVFIGIIWALVIYDLGSIHSGSGIEQLKVLLKGEYSGNLMSALIRYFSPIMFSITGIAGGIFAPSLSAAAEISSYLSSLLSLNDMQAILALVSMSAFLTGLIHAPLTSFILVFEMTDVRIATLPMLLSVITAFAVAKLISKKSFYHEASAYFASSYR